MMLRFFLLSLWLAGALFCGTPEALAGQAPELSLTPDLSAGQAGQELESGGVDSPSLRRTLRSSSRLRQESSIAPQLKRCPAPPLSSLPRVPDRNLAQVSQRLHLGRQRITVLLL